MADDSNRKDFPSFDFPLVVVHGLLNVIDVLMSLVDGFPNLVDGLLNSVD